MKISRFEVENLFGKHDYILNFARDRNIYILTGSNGSGKSTILRTMFAMSNLDLINVCCVPAKKIYFQFDNKFSFSIIRKGRHNHPGKILFELQTDSGQKIKEQFTLSQFPEDGHYLSELENLISWPKTDYIRVDDYRWLNFKTGQFLDPEKLNRKSEFVFPEMLDFRFDHNEFYQFFKLILNNWRTGYLDTKRLYRIQGPGTGNLTELLNNFVSGLTREISEILEQKTKTRQHVTEELTKTFQARLKQELSETKLKSITQVKDELINLKEKWNEIGEYLGIPPEDPSSIKINENPDPDSLRLLNLHLSDSKKILQIYLDLFDRIKFFTGFMNRNLSGKTVEYKPDAGIKIYTEEQEELNAGDLSSGEQHQLILWFEIVFQNFDLTMIDEPELSLHITWQAEFIKELNKFINPGDRLFIVATHSPDIIDQFWDLTFEL